MRLTSYICAMVTSLWEDSCKSNDGSVRDSKIVNDAVFGIIPLKPHISAIIDTVEFQRLRCIWQLGVTPFVYPTANHTRFEHSIGTYHLASRLVTQLKTQLENEKNDKVDPNVPKNDPNNAKEYSKNKEVICINDKDVMCVEIAALCHDIGHGPFSHVWDLIILPEILKGFKIKHEDISLEIFDILIKNEKVKKIFTKENIKEKHINLIKDIIKGEIVNKEKYKKDINKYEMLCSIVSNSDSGMDVDKWDYLARDSNNLGHASTNFRGDIDRMIHLARAIKDDKDEWKIAFRKTEGLNMLRVFQLRHYMYQTAYIHRKVVAIELMMLDGFKKYFEKVEYIELQKIGTAEGILKQTDSIFWSNVDKIPEFKRILERDHYQPIFEAVKYKKEDNPEKDFKKFLKKKDPNNEIRLLENVRFGFNSFKLSSTNNPMLNINFYTKKEMKKITKYTANNLPSYLQYDVDESRFMVFSINSDEQHEILKYLEMYFKDKNKDKWFIVILKYLNTYFKDKNTKDKWIFGVIEEV